MEFDCDRCGERDAHVGMWEDNILCGRFDTICDSCYDDGERIARPIEPPYDEDGEQYYHIQFVDCPHCGNSHEQHITDTLGICPYRSSERADHEDTVFEIDRGE